MNANLFLKELQRSRKNLMIWSAIVVGLTVMVLAIFPSMAEMGESIGELMSSMPPELSKALGMDENTWSSILGFYSTYYGIYIVVLVSIYTTSTGATIISKEEKDRTSEFLLTRPISRLTIFKSKIASLITLSLIIYGVQTLFAIAGIAIFGNDSVNWNSFIIMHLNGLVLVLFFTAVGVLISMFVTPKKNFMGMVVGITFGSYFINAIAKSTDSTSWLGYFSPFHYMDFSINDPDYSFNFISAICMIVLSVTMLIYAYTFYKKKDIDG